MSSKGEGLFDAAGRSVLQGAAVLGAAVFFTGLAISPARTWGSLLVANFYFLSAALGGTVFISIQYVSSAGWPTVFRRVPEAMAAYLIPGGLLMGGLCFGIHDLYHWSHHEAVQHDAILHAKSAYLNTPGFVMRMGVYLFVWWLFSWLIRKNSLAQDQDGDVVYTRKNTALSAVFLVVFAVTFTLASIDWVMSLEPHWFSTIFPWYVFGGLFIQGIAMMTALIILLRKRGVLKEVSAGHFHDLGKYLFAFSVFWAYLWFSQYLLIWYSNIPEETVYFIARAHGGWNYLFWMNLVVNFLAPFALFLRVRSKKSEGILLSGCLLILFGRWLDLYLMVMPPVAHGSPAIGSIEVFVFLGAGSIFLLAFDRAFRSASDIPKMDPFLEESLHHHIA